MPRPADTSRPADAPRILFLANWPLRDAGQGGAYAFFSQWTRRPRLTLMGTFALGAWTRFERFRLRFYLVAPIVAWFRSFAYDAVVAYSSQVGLPLAMMFRLTMRRTPLVVFDVETLGRPTGRRLALVRFAAKRFDRLVYASRRQLDFYRTHLADLVSNARYIPIGIGAYPKRRPLGEVVSGPILASGHHGKAFRDWATLLRAYAPMASSAPLLIAGRETLGDDDCDGVPIPDGVRFAPFMPADKYQDLVEDARFVVIPLPNRAHSLGQLSVLFCMAMGKAVIATRMMGVEDYVDDGETGLLVPPGDADALRAAMERLLANPDLATRMGVRGFEQVRDVFNDRRMGLAWEEMMDELLKSRVL